MADASPLQAASDRIRASAQWIVTAVAAVGGALAAGLQISSIGDVADSTIGWAWLGFVLTLSGTAMAIFWSTKVIGASFVTLHDLATNARLEPIRSQIDPDAIVLGGAESVADLRQRFGDAISRRRAAIDRYYEDLPLRERESLEAGTQAAIDHAQELSTTVGHVLERASYLRVRSAYETARPIIILGAFIAAFGLGLFAFAAGADEAQPIAVTSAPARVLVTAGEDGQLAPILGDTCASSPFEATLIGVSGEIVVLAVTADGACPAAVVVASLDTAADDHPVVSIARAEEETE